MIEVSPVTGAVGAEISGVDLRSVSEEQRAEPLELWLEPLVIRRKQHDAVVCHALPNGAEQSPLIPLDVEVRRAVPRGERRWIAHHDVVASPVRREHPRDVPLHEPVLVTGQPVEGEVFRGPREVASRGVDGPRRGGSGMGRPAGERARIAKQIEQAP